MPPKKGETECKNKEDFSLLQIFGKVFYPPPGSPPGFLSESGCKSTAFFRTRKLIAHFFCRFLEFIFKRIVIQTFTEEWFFMKGLRCTESYTLLYYIRGKKKTAPDFFSQKPTRYMAQKRKQGEKAIQAGWNWNHIRMKLETKTDEFFKQLFQILKK